MKNIIILLQFACILLLVVLKFAGGNEALPAVKEPPRIIVKNLVQDALNLLKSDDAEKSNKGAEQILEIKKTIAIELYNIVENDKVTCCLPLDAKPAKLNALRLLGEFQDHEYPEAGLTVLYNNLLYGCGNECDEAGVPSPVPPAVKSLVAIGKPSTDFLLPFYHREFCISDDNFGKIPYRLPAETEYGPPDKRSVDSTYNEWPEDFFDKNDFLSIYDLFKLIITNVYTYPEQTKYFVQEAMDRNPSGREKENVKKNLKKMLLLHD